MNDNDPFGKEDVVDTKFLIFSYNDTKIITLIEGDDEESTIIIRDVSGKYSWTFKQFYNSLKKDPKQLNKLIGILDDLSVPGNNISGEHHEFKW
jgi:hypothetical protein